MKRRKKRSCGGNAIRRFVKMMDLPEFVSGRDECIEIWGGNTVLVEGAQGIHTYEPQTVKIHMKRYLLVLTGENFQLAQFGEGCLRVTGNLTRLEWEDANG